MPISFYRYAQCILDEMHADCNWQENEVAETIYRIHSYAQDMLLEADEAGGLGWFGGAKRQSTLFRRMVGR